MGNCVGPKTIKKLDIPVTIKIRRLSDHDDKGYQISHLSCFTHVHKYKDNASVYAGGLKAEAKAGF